MNHIKIVKNQNHIKNILVLNYLTAESLRMYELQKIKRDNNTYDEP